MPIKITAALVAVVLLLAYLVPIAWKLKQTSLWVVMGIGIAMMLVDLWQSLRNGNG